MLLWPNMYAPVSVRLLWGVPAKSRNLHNSAYTSRTANLALCALTLLMKSENVIYDVGWQGWRLTRVAA